MLASRLVSDLLSRRFALCSLLSALLSRRCVCAACMRARGVGCVTGMRPMLMSNAPPAENSDLPRPAHISVSSLPPTLPRRRRLPLRPLSSLRLCFSRTLLLVLLRPEQEQYRAKVPRKYAAAARVHIGRMSHPPARTRVGSACCQLRIQICYGCKRKQPHTHTPPPRVQLRVRTEVVRNLIPILRNRFIWLRRCDRWCRRHGRGLSDAHHPFCRCRLSPGCRRSHPL